MPVAADLLPLGVFKYANFGSGNGLSGWFAFSARLPTLDIVLPAGVSFYTFHTISYIVDSYRGTIKPTRNLLEFACYVSFFARLVAGPIVRFRQVEADLENLRAAPRLAPGRRRPGARVPARGGGRPRPGAVSLLAG